MSRYAMYLRKSRADLEAEAHGEGETLSRHKAALTELARRMKLNVEAVYEEIVSGETIAARPQMQRLLSEVGAGEWDGVLVMEIERLARGDTMDQGLVAQTFKYSNTKIITPIKTFDPSNEFDEEYFEFGLFMARREFTTTNRRLVRGRQASAKEGKYVGSVAPYGYKKVKIENDKGYTLEIFEEQANVVRMAFDWYTNGVEINGEKKTLGIHAIAARMNELGIKSLAGKEYWTYYGVRNMLSNPVYIGKIRWGYRKAKKIVTPDGKKRKLREFSDEGEYLIVDGLHEPIIAEDVFYEAQRITKERSAAPIKKNHELKNIFAGLMYCAKCGRAMMYNSYKNENGYERKPRIHCGTPGCACSSSPFDLVEERVLKILRGWVREYNIDKARLKRDENVDKEIERMVSANETEIQSLQAQLNKVYDFLEKGIYSEEVFKQRSETLNRQITELEEKSAKLKAELAINEERRKAQTEFAPQVAHLLEIYDKIDNAEKNRLLKLIILRIVYDKEIQVYDHTKTADAFTLGVYPRLPRKDD